MQTISLPVLEAGEYAGGIWYYEPHTYQSYRYVLGRVGKHPLVCIGINPSTAQPGALDPTLKSVERLAAANGFDSWIMFNVYPQRATDPNDMDKTPDRALCDENLRWLQAVLAQTEPTMWALNIIIFVLVYGRMLEIYMLTSLAPIPVATLSNREVGQMGQNYLKSLFAVGFQGLLILLCVGIYGVLVQGISTSGDPIGAIWGCVGYTVLLCFMLFKTGTISKSIFGAH